MFASITWSAATATFGACLCLLVSASAGESPDDGQLGQIWAVLVAGSHGFDNYRHQADVCHAYQILRKRGVPGTNIIVMMYDDIAYNIMNPNPGMIINKPGGPNVYTNITKDYIGLDVTPENFMNILLGNEEKMKGIGSGKVLKSGPKDRVFVNFVDRGSVGFVAFPNGCLYSDQLKATLAGMRNKHMFKELVFYMESCKAGTMFEDILPNDWNIFVTTASNSTSCSYCTYWNDTMGLYLGDEFSVAWMEDTDSTEGYKNSTTETLWNQLSNVIKRVNQSRPTAYGQKSIGQRHVKDFLGPSKKPGAELEELEAEGRVSPMKKFTDSVSTYDARFETLRRRLQSSRDNLVKAKLQEELDRVLEGRKTISELFERILSQLVPTRTLMEIETENPRLKPDDMSCYRTIVDGFSAHCVNINKNTFALRFVHLLAVLCSSQSVDYPSHSSSPDHVLRVFGYHCTHRHRSLDGVF